MGLAEIQNQAARGAILNLLQDGISVNIETIVSAVQNVRAIQVNDERVQAAAYWLRDQGLVEIKKIGDYEVLRITSEGENFQAGRSFIPGIKRARD